MGKYRWPRWRNVWCIFNLVLTCKGTSLPKIWTYVSLWMLAGGTAHINPWTGVNEHPGKLQWDKLCRNTSTSFPSYLSSSQSWICHGSIKLALVDPKLWTHHPPHPITKISQSWVDAIENSILAEQFLIACWNTRRICCLEPFAWRGTSGEPLGVLVGEWEHFGVLGGQGRLLWVSKGPMWSGGKYYHFQEEVSFPFLRAIISYISTAVTNNIWPLSLYTPSFEQIWYLIFLVIEKFFREDVKKMVKR